MKVEDFAKLIEAQFTSEDLAAIEKMSEAEKKEFGDWLAAHVKDKIERTKAKADELVRLAKAEGANVDGSKGMQFLIGCVAGLQVRLDDLDKQVAEHHEIVGPKLILNKLRDRVAKKETT